MLRYLRIQHFALVRNLELELGKGLTVFLGETGAGKSVILEGIAAAMGERVRSDVVPPGQTKSIVECEYCDIPFELVEDYWPEGADWEPESLTIRREILQKGSSRYYINHSPLPASAIKLLAPVLLDFHGQHDTYGLLTPAVQRSILDTVSTPPELLHSIKEQVLHVQREESKLENLMLLQKTSDEQKVVLEFQLNEIQTLQPQPNELEQIQQRLSLLEHREFVETTVESVYHDLYEGADSAYGKLRSALKRVHQLLPFDSTLERYFVDVESAAIAAQELASAVTALRGVEEFSAIELDALRQRAADLQRLVHKFGSIQAAIDRKDYLTEQLHTIEHSSERIIEQQAVVEALHSVATATARTITQHRTEGAVVVRNELITNLEHMGMPNATMEILVEPSELHTTGADSVTFCFSANPGQTAKAIQSIASGGELSRVMLAIKTIQAQKGTSTTLVLDEIDTGISGKVARDVGQHIQLLAQSTQILCITHLPQIASLAQNFVLVKKHVVNGDTEIVATVLAPPDALSAVAALVSGETITESAMAAAKELMSKSVHEAPKVTKRTPSAKKSNIS
jgi:DNA repair protein RecN (Recombination protein N)